MCTLVCVGQVTRQSCKVYSYSVCNAANGAGFTGSICKRCTRNYIVTGDDDSIRNLSQQLCQSNSYQHQRNTIENQTTCSKHHHQSSLTLTFRRRGVVVVVVSLTLALSSRHVYFENRARSRAFCNNQAQQTQHARNRCTEQRANTPRINTLARAIPFKVRTKLNLSRLKQIPSAPRHTRTHKYTRAPPACSAATRYAFR